MPADPNVMEIPFQPSAIETIDRAMFTWLDEEMNVFCTTKDGWEKVPTIWASPERAFMSKDDKDYRDEEGGIIFPAITIERTGMVKDPAFKGIVQSHVQSFPDYRNGALPVARTMNQFKTAKFANKNSARKWNSTVGHGQLNFKYKKENKQIVYKTHSMPVPVYVTVMYSINVKSLYQQQMNEIMQPFIVKTGGINHFMIEQDEHRFEAFFQQDFSQENNVSSMAEEERKFESKFDIKVLGYLIGAENNDEQPKLSIRENAVEYRFQRERVIFEDKVTHTDKIKKYRRGADAIRTLGGGIKD